MIDKEAAQVAAYKAINAFMSRTETLEPYDAGQSLIYGICHLLEAMGEDAEQAAFRAIGQFQRDMETDPEDIEEAA